MKNFSNEINIFSAKAATGTGKVINVQDFNNIALKLGTSNNANFTIKFQVSNSDTAPDFSSAASVTNHWTYAAFIDYISGSVTAGGTGITSAGTDVFQNIQVNTSGIKWICATITAYSAGKVTLSAVLYDNH